jgi:hypothetical protein
MTVLSETVRCRCALLVRGASGSRRALNERLPLVFILIAVVGAPNLNAKLLA